MQPNIPNIPIEYRRATQENDAFFFCFVDLFVVLWPPFTSNTQETVHLFDAHSNLLVPATQKMNFLRLFENGHKITQIPEISFSALHFSFGILLCHALAAHCDWLRQPFKWHIQI